MPKIPSYILSFLAIISFVLTSQFAVAETIDLKTLSCRDLLEVAQENVDDAVFISTWLDGYLSGVTGDTELSEEGFGFFVEKLLHACERSPNALVLNVSRIVGIK